MAAVLVVFSYNTFRFHSISSKKYSNRRCLDGSYLSLSLEFHFENAGSPEVTKRRPMSKIEDKKRYSLLTTHYIVQ